MKLHRLVLTNYRGITHREIEFPDHGVVVVCGANEIGKSSMIEALDLLLDAKDRSTKKEIKQVKPTHADVGAEITAEISTGPYRFVYRKRFHKKAETALTVLAPRREQLTGDEAHDRVRAILEETVDVALWEAQRVLQSTSTAAVDLSGCDALSRALDVAAGEAVALSGAEPLLIDRIDAEYLRYFTPTGRPTGEWAAVTKRMRDADDDVARCAAAVAEVDDAVRSHATLTAELERLADERAEAANRLLAARTAADEVAALIEQLKQAEVVAAAAEATVEASVSALTERRRLQSDVTERTVAVGALETAAAQAHDEELTAREVQQAAEAAAESARAAVQTSQDRVDAARRAVERFADRDEAERLAGRLVKVDAALREVARVESELATIAVTDASMRDIEAAAAAVDRAAAQAEWASAHIEAVAVADVELRIGGEPVALEAGRTWSANATTTTDIDVPGVLTVRVMPGAPASDTQAELQAAQHVLTTALAAAKAGGVVEARALEQRRRELVG
ncbi:MAG: AAA family ATPase, partial [Mycobacterium sp.]